MSGSDRICFKAVKSMGLIDNTINTGCSTESLWSKCEWQLKMLLSAFCISCTSCKPC